MNVVQEFSRFANQYDSHNIIQKRVAKELVAMIEGRNHPTIVDIGAGSGVLWEEITKHSMEFEQFIALDFSEAMLSCHPNDSKIKKKHFDFNNPKDFSQLHLPQGALILSSSALQWSMDLDFTLSSMAQLGDRFYFSLFTSNTFATLHRMAKIQSPIYNRAYILEILKKYYHFSYVVRHYELAFEESYEMFRYIKRSGVSGGERRLSYREMRRIMREYPHHYLEFEVLLVQATKKL